MKNNRSLSVTSCKLHQHLVLCKLTVNEKFPLK